MTARPTEPAEERYCIKCGKELAEVVEGSTGYCSFSCAEEVLDPLLVAANVTIAQAGGWTLTRFSGMAPDYSWCATHVVCKRLHADTFPELAAKAAAEVLK